MHMRLRDVFRHPAFEAVRAVVSYHLKHALIARRDAGPGVEIDGNVGGRLRFDDPACRAARHSEATKDHLRCSLLMALKW